MTDMQSPRRWFITGVSSGFGREMALALVRSGDPVVGSVRREEQRAALEADGIGTVVMDVTDPAQVETALARALDRLGGIDVLVNNAGYGLAGAIEALALDEIRAVMETNFFGVVRVTGALLSRIRAGRGTIVNISSMAGQIGFGGMGAYNASKFALEGYSEALSEELQPFGAKVLIVEPGAFRTDFSGRSIQIAAGAVAAYAGSQAGEIGARLGQYHGHEPGDPVKAVNAIIAAVRSADPPLRLPLGADAVAGIRAKLDRLGSDMDAWRADSIATAFDPA